LIQPLQEKDNFRIIESNQSFRAELLFIANYQHPPLDFLPEIIKLGPSSLKSIFLYPTYRHNFNFRIRQNCNRFEKKLSLMVWSLKMKTKQIALVTGATSGIGKAYAVCFARGGYDLILTGRRMDKLNELAHELRELNGCHVRVIKAELGEDDDLQKVIRAIESHDNIFILVNNAGFGSGIEFCRNTLDDHMKMLHVHVEVSVKLVYAVLPQMIGRKKGAIINVSSLGAYMPAPGSSMYSATKLFLASFTESLHMEVHKHNIKVQCVCPGFTHTDFHERRAAGKLNNSGKMMWMEPEEVVEKSVRSLTGNSTVIIPGIMNRWLVGIVSLIPRRLYYFIMERSGKIKTGPGFFNQMKHLVEKPVSFFFPAHADQV